MEIYEKSLCNRTAVEGADQVKDLSGTIHIEDN